MTETIAAILLWFSLCTAWWKLCTYADSALRADAKAQIREVITGGNFLRIREISSSIIAIFDTLFSARRMSLRFLQWSMLWSFGGSLVFFVIFWLATDARPIWRSPYPVFSDMLEQIAPNLLNVIDWRFFAYGLLVIPIISNLIVDYISFVETRLVLGWMARFRSLLFVLLVALDIFLTLVIIFAVYYLVFTCLIFFSVVVPAAGEIHAAFAVLGRLDFFVNMLQAHLHITQEFVSHVPIAAEILTPLISKVQAYIGPFTVPVTGTETLWYGINPDVIFPALFYSTFSTSIWIWSYVLSSLAGRVLYAVMKALKMTSAVLDFEKQPLHALAFAGVIIITIVGFALGIASVFAW